MTGRAVHPFDPTRAARGQAGRARALQWGIVAKPFEGMPLSDSSSAPSHPPYATCASGLEHLLAAELESLGLESVRRAGAGASFSGGLEAAYRACLHSRVANRVLWPLHAGPAGSPEALYERVQEIDWGEHLDVDGSLAVDLFTARSTITHSRYGALKVKDAVVDQFRDATGRRPDVDRDTPDVRINVYLFRDKARIALDLSGSSLHRRGYREDGGPAPLKENLAAALLLAAGWPALADEGVAFADPLCGSGTLLTEAAMIACRRAPGLGRRYFGFLGWKRHDGPLWERLIGEARAAERASPAPIAGGDRDAGAVAGARRHLDNAAVGQAVSLETRALADGALAALANVPPGLVLTNPPYGERLAAGERFYQAFGEALSTHYDGWRCGVFTARAAPLASTRLQLLDRLEIANGGIDCVYAEGRIPTWSTGTSAGASPGASSGPPRGASARLKSRAVPATEPESAPSSWELALRGSATPATGGTSGTSSSEGRADRTRHPGRAIDIEPFVNRLRKNLKALRGWRRQQGVSAWRAYDADLPEFAVAIDVYDTESRDRHVVVQEYRAPATVNTALAAARLDAVVTVLPEVLETPAARVHVKVRERQSGTSQYERRTDGGGVRAVLEERGCRWTLNFSDYLDTGIFLDHRNVRRLVAERARGGRFLNLFAYTGAATVAAVVGGARESVSVDLSNRYCRWAEENLALNGADRDAHRVERADVVAWLDRPSEEAPFDVILLDPPTFSNSTDTEADWNVQRDHVAALEACLGRLAPGGVLVFSNNFRRFRLDESLERGQLGSERVRVEERSRWSIGRDFGRSPRIHRVWLIERAADPSRSTDGHDSP